MVIGLVIYFVYGAQPQRPRRPASRRPKAETWPTSAAGTLE